MWLGLKTQSTAGVIDWILRLREEVGVPRTLAGLKVDDERIDEIAAAAEIDPTAGGNPVKFDRAAADRFSSRRSTAGSEPPAVGGRRWRD